MNIYKGKKMGKTRVFFEDDLEGQQNIQMEGTPDDISRAILKLTEVLMAQIGAAENKDKDLEEMKRDFEQYMRSFDA